MEFVAAGFTLLESLFKQGKLAKRLLQTKTEYIGPHGNIHVKGRELLMTKVKDRIHPDLTKQSGCGKMTWYIPVGNKDAFVACVNHVLGL